MSHLCSPPRGTDDGPPHVRCAAAEHFALAGVGCTARTRGLPLPHPAANAPLATVNDNRRPAGARAGGTLTLSLDIVEAAYQPEGEHDPVVRILAFAETGKAPTVPGPLLRAPVGTTVRLTLRNRSDSAVMSAACAGRWPPDETRCTSRRERRARSRSASTGLETSSTGPRSRDSRASTSATGSTRSSPARFVVDSAGAPPPSAQERVWLITEWFYQSEDVALFESALTFNGKAWPYNERLTFTQNDSVHFRVINAAAVEHPLHLHGFYFRVARHGGARADTVVSASTAAAAEHADHSDRRIAVAVVLADDAGQLGVPLPLRGARRRDRQSARFARRVHRVPSVSGDHAMPAHDMPGGHTMRGLVIGMHITPARGLQRARGHKPPS